MRKTTTAKPDLSGLPKREPWKPADWEVEDAGALQALMRGTAAPHQQQRALKYIVYALAGTHDLAYRPGGDGDTAFACGKQFVGQQIETLLNLDLSQFTRSSNARSSR